MAPCEETPPGDHRGRRLAAGQGTLPGAVAAAAIPAPAGVVAMTTILARKAAGALRRPAAARATSACRAMGGAGTDVTSHRGHASPKPGHQGHVVAARKTRAQHGAGREQVALRVAMGAPARAAVTPPAARLEAEHVRPAGAAPGGRDSQRRAGPTASKRCAPHRCCAGLAPCPRGLPHSCWQPGRCSEPS